MTQHSNVYILDRLPKANCNPPLFQSWTACLEGLTIHESVILGSTGMCNTLTCELRKEDCGPHQKRWCTNGILCSLQNTYMNEAVLGGIRFPNLVKLKVEPGLETSRQLLKSSCCILDQLQHLTTLQKAHHALQ